MQTDGITWKVVNNTVEKRMIDFSLIHKLVPCKKVRRRTKVMNVQMKKMHGVKSYSQYIKMKTSILRNLSDDSETDDSEYFTDDDYSILYKSDVSLSKYVMDMSRKSVNYLCEGDDSPNKENNTSNIVNRENNTSKTANKKSSTSKIASKKNNTFNTSNKKNNTSNTEKKRNDKSDTVNKKSNTSNTESKKNQSSIVHRKLNSRSCKSKSPDAIGWQRVIKKKPSENVSFSTDTSGNTKLILDNSFFFPVHDEAEDDLKLVVSEQSFDTDLEESNLSEENDISRNKACTANEMLELHNETTDINEITHNIITGQEIRNEEHKSVEQPILPATETDKEMENPSNEQSQLDENYSQEMIGSQNSPENVKRNLMSTFNDENKMQNFEKPSVSTNISTDEVHMDCLNTSSNNGKTSANEDKDEMISEMQLLFNENVNQPKDSGIDEDTEEESLESGKKVRRKLKKKVTETLESFQGTSSTLEHENNCAVEINPSLLNNDNTDDLNNNENVMSSPFKGEHSTEEDKTEDQQDRTVRQRSQPRVMYTEIVNKKYRIVPCEASFSDDCTYLETNARHFSDEEGLETVERSQYMDDSVSPLTKKRLQQLRRLNLTADSESSLSEDDDDSYCTKENMRNKLLKRSKESSDISSSEDENSNFGHVMSVEYAEKEIRHKKFRRGKYKEEESPCSSTMHKEKKNKSDSDNLNCCTFKSPSKNDSFKTITNDKNTLENFFKGTTSCSDGEDNFKSFGIRNLDPRKSNHLNGIENRNFDRNCDEKGSDTNNLESGTKTESTDKKSRICRPSNLQGFIEEENLVHDTTIPSFKFKDIQDEDDVFILDIPSAVLERELVGKKIVLTKNKLKLGKEKYKVIFRDVDHVSCVFGTGKSRKPYKTVNIKPVARIVANQKIVKSSKRSNQYTSDAVSYTNGKSEIETDVCLSEKRHKKKHDTLFKEER